MSLIGAAYHDERRAARERRSLATALIAEFNGAIQIEQEVGYRAEYQRCLDQIRAGHPEPMPNFHYEWDGGRSIYYTNLPRIGILPENVTNKLIRGASAFQVVVADRQCMDRGDWNTQSPEKRADMLARHLQMYDQVLVLCGEIITDLRKVK
tara:strand:- start:1185 stop:1640 length:456 start_codon:yes stop_codon:yes gene_type:complete